MWLRFIFLCFLLILLVSILFSALLVTADVVGLYPNIPHEAGLKALKEALDKRKNRNIPTNDFIRMTEFVLKHNYFEFTDQVKQQISGTAIGTKFAPTYACIFMDDVESKFLKTQSFDDYQFYIGPRAWYSVRKFNTRYSCTACDHINNAFVTCSFLGSMDTVFAIVLLFQILLFSLKIIHCFETACWIRPCSYPGVNVHGFGPWA